MAGFVITDTDIYAVIVLWAVGKILSRFGGVKISYWRARGITFFSYVLKNPNHDRKTYSKKSTALTHHSPLGFEHSGDGGIYFYPTKEILPEGASVEDYIDRWFGGPLIEYREGDARPMPISKSDGNLMNPIDLMKPYKNKSYADLNRIGIKTPRLERIATYLSIIAVLGIVALLYYQLLYGQSIACAVHAHGFACG